MSAATRLDPHPLRLHGGPDPDPDPDAGPDLAGFLKYSRLVRSGMSPDRARQSIKSITGIGETIDSDGGLVVTAEQIAGIWRQAVGLPLPMRFCDTRTVRGNHTLLPTLVDSTGASRRGGITAGWTPQGNQFPGVVMKVRGVGARLNKLGFTITCSNELVEDSTVWDDLRPIAAEELAMTVSDAVLNGLGDGEPLGVLNSPTTGVVNPVGSQPAASVVAANIAAMVARLAPDGRANAVFFVCPEHEDEWFANGSISPDLTPLIRFASPAERLMFPGSARYTLCGIPTFPCELCQPAGSKGDIVLFDGGQYLLTTKDPATRMQLSAEIHFDRDETVLKFLIRCDGSPKWVAPRSAYRGNSTQYAAVTLAARS